LTRIKLTAFAYLFSKVINHLIAEVALAINPLV